MYKYLIKRTLLIIPTLLGAALLVFFLMRLVPGDICEVSLSGEGEHVTERELETCRTNLGLNDPLPAQFANMLTGFATFDLGDSMWTGKPITHELGLRFELTVQLALMTVVVAVLIGVPLGVISAVKRQTWVDYVVRSFAIAGEAIPSFWLGLMIILIMLILTQQLLGAVSYTHLTLPTSG